MKVAIVHDYLYQFGGAEKCVESWLKLYPQADIYASFSIPEKFTSSELITEKFQQKKVFNSKMQWLFKPKFMLKFQKHLFFLYPIFMSFWTIKNYDLVIISATFCGKNVKFKNCHKIVYYCYTPTRFLHGFITETDQKTIPLFLRKMIPIFTFWLKIMDLKAVRYLKKNHTKWLTISNYIQTITKKAYKVNSEVVYPPVEIDRFLALKREPVLTVNKGAKENYQEPFYLYYGRISFHKRVDLVIQACLELNKKLLIAGQAAFAPELVKLKEIIAQYETKDPSKKGLVKFLGRVPDDERDELLRKTKAFIFPVKEDFGIVSIESFATGTPLIAYKAGGALEYVKEGVNGVFFEKQGVESLKKAILEFEKVPFKGQSGVYSSNQKFWDDEKIRETSKPFAEEKFLEFFKNQG